MLFVRYRDQQIAAEAELQKTRSELEASRAAQSSAQTERSAAELQIEELEAKVFKYKSEWTKMNDMLVYNRKVYEKQVAKVQEQRADAAATAAAAAATADASFEQQMTELKELKKQNSLLTEELSVTKAQLDSALKVSAEEATKQLENKDTRRQLYSTRMEVESLTTQLKNIAYAHDSSKEELKRLSALLSASDKSYENIVAGLQRALYERANECADLQIANQSLSTNMNNAKSRLDELERERDAAKHEFAALKTASQDSSSLVQNQQKELHAAREKHQDLERQFQTMIGERDAAQKELASAKAVTQEALMQTSKDLASLRDRQGKATER